MVGHEAVDNVEGHGRQVEHGVEPGVGMIGAADGSYLAAVLEQQAVDIVGAVVLGHVYEFGREVADGTLLVGEGIDGEG